MTLTCVVPTYAQTQGMERLGRGAYEVSVATATLPEPEWPDIDFKKIIETAFKDKIIRTPDHPVLRRLRGEV